MEDESAQGQHGRSPCLSLAEPGGRLQLIHIVSHTACLVASEQAWGAQLCAHPGGVLPYTLPCDYALCFSVEVVNPFTASYSLKS